MAATALILVTVLSAVADLSAGRVYKIIRTSPSYDIWRAKRQSHPLATQVRIPEVAFADAPDSGPSGPPPSVGGSQGVVPGPLPEIADYLTPPPPADGVLAATTGRQQQQDGKWELGYDANDILVPPAEQAREYDTLKVFSLVPSSAGPLSPDVVLEDSRQILLQQQDNSLAGSSGQETRLPREEERQRYQPSVDQGPVYTYVKTDKHGNFKWGVRQGH